MTISLILEHLFIVLAASILSVIVGLPLGIGAYIWPKIRRIILQIVDLLQTIPSLALLGIIMVFVGPGKPTVIAGITLYSLLPIVRNTVLGFDQVDSGIKEAARGMGMNRPYQIFRVELPLAFPMTLTGIRSAIVNAIGTAVFAAFVGGGGLGSTIYQGIRTQNMTAILTGTAALMVIAVALDLSMAAFEKRAGNPKVGIRALLIPIVLLLAVFIATIPFGVSTTDDTELLLYDGDYSETQIMHHMVKILVEDQTALTVTIQDQMSQVNNFAALVDDNPTCDLMISYDGTLLTTFLHLDTGDVPEDSTLYDYANSVAQEKYGVYLMEKLGFDNTYAIAITAQTAEKYSITTISELVEIAEELTFGAEHEFFTEEGSMKYTPFTEFYGLSFKKAVSVDGSLKYTAAGQNSFDVLVVYATDGLNRKYNLQVLEDDQSFFPEYNGAFLVREDTFERFADVAPNLEELLNTLAGQISNDDMVEMTYQVDVEGRSVDDVAREFLAEHGLISE